MVCQVYLVLRVHLHQDQESLPEAPYRQLAHAELSDNLHSFYEFDRLELGVVVYHQESDVILLVDIRVHHLLKTDNEFFGCFAPWSQSLGLDAHHIIQLCLEVLQEICDLQSFVTKNTNFKLVLLSHYKFIDKLHNSLLSMISFCNNLDIQMQFSSKDNF